VSPDERAFDNLVSRALRRSRTLAVLDAIAWGGTGAAAYMPLGAAIGLAVAAWRLGGVVRQTIVRAIEHNSNGRNIFVTADELLRGRIRARPEIRQRVFADAAALCHRIDLSAVYPIKTVVRTLTVATVAWLLALTTGVWRSPVARVAREILPAVPVGRPASAETVHVMVTTEPPTYTGLTPKTVADPAEVAAVQGSTLTVAIESRASGRVTVDHDGAPRTLSADATGRVADRIELTRTGYYAITTDAGARRVISIVVSPDALPTVRITVPGRDLVYADANQRVSFDVRALDDFGLRSLTLQYTKVAGSGEQFDFHEGEVALSIVRPNNRDWRGTAARSLAELGLEEGGMLVYRAVAADARPGAGTGSSDSFFIEISRLGVGAGFTVPEQETRYALSQQMLVLKTARLDRGRGSIPAAEFNEAAMNLAVEQRMIRAEFVFMLGGEIEDEEVEAAQSTELQEGRLQNRGQRDLRQATVSMSQAEKLLTGGSTREALTAEREASAALQRAFARDRYILRALTGQTRLDPSRRLTGVLSQAGDWRRVRPPPIENRRAALLQDLLAGVGSLVSDSPSSRIVVLAGEALRIDPDSVTLRRIAADLQRIAESWAAARADARKRALTDVVAAVQRETTLALAAPALQAPFASSSIAGAFADAVSRGGLR
jgi:hypothetical protein